MKPIDDIPRAFQPSDEEGAIYESWQKAGAFGADSASLKPRFTISMPPPNITGQLHLGHVLDNALQDAIIRHRRMQGYEALWVPGTDHAAIATEARVVQHLKERGLAKADLSRQDFLQHVWDWKEEYGGRIIDQLKRLGASCDWSRLAFTMDEHLSKAVTHVFVSLYREGLIYRGEQIVNWCPHCRTTISDAEVEHETREDRLYTVAYPFADGDGHVALATTRPETMFADVAVAVHPDDGRYQGLVGRRLKLPLTSRTLPLIADPYVDPEFGTGAVKITPGHDPNDFEVGERHGLEILTVLDEDAILNEHTGPYQGLGVDAARKKVVADLEAAGLLLESQPLRHNVGHCYRCRTRIEPRVSLQWFVRMAPLAAPAIEAVRDGRVVFIPEHFAKTYFNWMENIRDWSISRQLWWGHRIPAWTCEACGRLLVEMEEPTVCPDCKQSRLTQDPDTLDTWFSSALWPFSTLGWPDRTSDFEAFYPTQMLVTGYDIIFFWVARMIFSGLHHTGEAPFSTVLIHGMVRDEKGRKMSKSLGNGIDPIDLIEAYGADALRFTVYANQSQGQDQRFQVNRIEAGRNFINKIWNACRFVRMNRSDALDLAAPAEERLRSEDRWILTGLQHLIDDVSVHMENYDFNLALARIYGFLWDSYCDWYIELVKGRLREEDEDAETVRWVLNEVLLTSMKLLHPFMPFVTESIYQKLEHEPGLLIRAAWPVSRDDFRFGEDYQTTERIMSAVRQIRNIRAEFKIRPKQKVPVIVVTEDPAILRSFSTAEEIFSRLADVGLLSPRTNDRAVPTDAVSAPFDGGALFVPLSGVVDIGAEAGRLKAQAEKLAAEIQTLKKKLANEAFTERAPQEVVETERERLQDLEGRWQTVQARQTQLEAML